VQAVASKPDPYARRKEDRFVVRRDVSWSELQRALEDRGERSQPRMAYLEGVLEIMSPGSHHEGLRGVIGRLVEVWCLEHDIEFTSLGNWTLQDESVARAVEPDECYVFGAPLGERSRPDLAIEVLWTSGSMNKLEIYRKLAVREVWIWNRGRLTAHALRGEMYEWVNESLVLPGIDLSQLASLLDQPTTSAAIRAYRDLLRKR